MIALVTAGFVGSHLCERLLEEGDDVRGVDCLTDYYAREPKDDNLLPLLDSERFAFTEADLNEVDLDGILQGVEVVYHLAAQPGVRPSWGESFRRYVRHNTSATQRLLRSLPSLVAAPRVLDPPGFGEPGPTTRLLAAPGESSAAGSGAAL